jgi:hypothetical protein
MVYRANTFRAVGNFDSRFDLAEDYDLWLRISEVGKIASISTPLVKIRRHDSRLSNLEGGRRQLRRATAAAICHLLRSRGLPDPAAANSAARWGDFMSWVDRRLEEEGEFDLHDSWERAGESPLASGSAPRLALRLLRSGRVFALLRRRLVGSTILHSLAEEWVAVVEADSR